MRFLRNVLLVGAALFCAGVVAFAIAVELYPVPSRERAASISQLVLAEDGQILRCYLTSDGKWRLTVSPAEVSRDYLDTLIAYEDRRFYQHGGVDIFALMRVAVQTVRYGRVVSGGSTLTKQVVRLLNPGMDGVRGKVMQILGAIRIERTLSKREILQIYLTLAPFGGNVEGVRTASLFFYGKEPSALNSRESAVLVAVAQSPSRRRPDRHPTAAVEAGDRISARLAGRGPAGSRDNGRQEISFVNWRPFIAPHFADRVRLIERKQSTITTTVDASLQLQVEQILQQALSAWPNEVNGAVLVLRNSDSAVRAYFGGSEFFAREVAGQFDHVRAVRSPGSTLKPMIYGLGFEAEVIHPSTIVTDAPININGYAPQNFNEEYQGDMTVRDALIKSINTIAVAVLARVAPLTLLTRLRSSDLTIQIEDTDASAGLAIALGGGGLTLESLTRLYAGIAGSGYVRPLKMLNAPSEGGGKRLLDPAAAWALRNILADAPPPNGFAQRRSMDGGRRVAYKTGTSYGYRDAWAIGFDQAHTIGVWLGRSDGAPVPGAMGITAAAPLLFRIFDTLPTPQGDVAGSAPRNSILTHRANLPRRLERWGGASRDRQAQHPLRIISPRGGAVIAAELDGDGAIVISLVAYGGNPPYFWFVDDKLLTSSDSRVRWRSEATVPISATLMDSSGLTNTIDFTIR